jgi:hypothetical protein
MLKILLTAVAIVTAIITPAAADMYVTGQWGVWQSQAGTNYKGQPQCVAGLLGTDRNFSVIFSPTGIFLRVWKSTWQIPAGQPIKVIMQVDQATPMSFDGIGRPYYPGSLVDIYIPLNAVWAATGKSMLEEVANLLSHGVRLKIYFPNGTEGGWEGGLSGATAALGSLVNCIYAMPSPTQPYSMARPAPTQPYAPTPTQPYGTAKTF